MGFFVCAEARNCRWAKGAYAVYHFFGTVARATEKVQGRPTMARALTMDVEHSSFSLIRSPGKGSWMDGDMSDLVYIFHGQTSVWCKF